LPDTDSGNGGLILGQQATLGQQAALQSLSFYIEAVNSSTLRLGLYDATGSGGLPGQKLAETALINPVVGWNTAPVISQIPLQAGTYWLVYEPSSSALSFKASFNVGPVAIGNANYGPLPPTFPSPVSNAGHWSFYATLTSAPPDPTQFGMWSGTVSLPLVPVHSALLPDGRILMSDGQSDGATAIVWNPATNTTDPVPPAPVNIFCGAWEQMADGRILVVGGHAGAHIGLFAANIFDPASEQWTVLSNMAFQRWYPTVTMLPDRRLIVTSGEDNCDGCDVKSQEIYDPSTGLWDHTPFQKTAAQFRFPYYPHVFLLPNGLLPKGKILVAATGEAPIVSMVMDLNPQTPAWTSVGGAAVDGGTTVMYLPGKFLKLGTSVDPDLPIRHSVATAYVLDMTQASPPPWRQVASMSFPRTYQNATSLPDGTMLVTGGGITTDAVGVDTAVLPAELWSPSTETWRTLAAMNAPRLYHSEALLLPDGRVVVLGGGRFNGIDEPTDQLSAEFFSPPYLFKGPRPVITPPPPPQLSYGQQFSVETPDASRIARVSLIRFGAVTHSINMGQRFLPLTFGHGTGSSLTIDAPVDANLAPPGNYMLFLVDTNGVPSLAAIVHF
jgi:hypothetical protein